MSDLIFENESQHAAEDAVTIVSDKWAIEVIRAVRRGHNRYGLMQKAIPNITKKMLTQTLRKLERNGIIDRIDYDENPPRVEYSITPMGDALVERLTMMCEWSKAFLEDVEQAREAYDAKNTGWV